MPSKIWATAVDELHETASVSEPTWASLQEHYGSSQLLELLVLAGWYRTIGYLTNGLLLDDEPWSAPVPTHEGRLDSTPDR